MIGEKFNRLTVIELHHKDKYYHKYYTCICDCGNYTVVEHNSLKRGGTKSCGCLNKELLSERNTKHGYSKDRRYKTALNILDRCNNKDADNYGDYGGKGIKCLISDNPIELYEYLITIDGYDDSKTIDRIDSEGHYEVGNLRWANQSEQVFNQKMSSKNTSGITGVMFVNNRWSAYIYKNRRRYGKTFIEKADAVKYRYELEIEFYGTTKMSKDTLIEYGIISI